MLLHLGATRNDLITRTGQQYISAELMLMQLGLQLLRNRDPGSNINLTNMLREYLAGSMARGGWDFYP